MEKNEEIQEYYELSKRYLEAAISNAEDELYEPAMANALHALELGLKSALFTVIKDPLKTHNIGGLFGKHFMKKIDKKKCKKINLIVARYNFPRYPGEEMLNPDEIKEDILFIKDMINNEIPKLIKKGNI